MLLKTSIHIKLFISIFLVTIITNCSNLNSNSTEEYQTISYLDIDIDSLGMLPNVPYVVDLKKDNKRLIVIGTLHSRDTNNPMFGSIEKIFKEFEPEIAINEGGQVHKKYRLKKYAISDNGELGLLKFLSDNNNIKMLNGDMSDSAEFKELSTLFSVEKALLFFASERFVLPYTYFGETKNIDSLYMSDFINGYLLKSGIVLYDKEKQFSYYKSLYKKYFNVNFSITDIHSDDFSPIRKTNQFCEIARKSKELRDKYLLRKIEEQLKYYDKVLVVFGGWHVLAIEPALKQIINKSKI